MTAMPRLEWSGLGHRIRTAILANLGRPLESTRGSAGGYLTRWLRRVRGATARPVSHANPRSERGGQALARAHTSHLDAPASWQLFADPDRRDRSSTGSVLESFAAAWDRGKRPAAEDYLPRLDPTDSRGAIELIYLEFCRTEMTGGNPDPESFLARFPEFREGLERVLKIHSACSPSLLGEWVESAGPAGDLPSVGDSIGSYYLRRELGSGSFARVFLAEQCDLENRLVVVKVTSRPTREPWLLARARHANIVEIVSHAMVDDGDYQLICMPFWGGATLGAVLAEARRRRHAPTTGADLLADLDAVAAPEYPGVHPTRPAREILASQSYTQAVAWVIARLAEALEHAFSRDVAHGDVKPSNILLSADANPMLLDFNLARDGARRGSNWSENDPGGTLAYMAPERVNSLFATRAGAHTPSNESSAAGSPPGPVENPGAIDDPLDRGPHVADIYSLGMVLLEALTTRPPDPAADPARLGSESDWERTPSLDVGGIARGAPTAMTARARIAAAERGSGRTVPAGLRAILERCLDPEPTRRYQRAWELAEDLNRWRTDRPLAFAAEPFWRQTVPRVFRRRRRTVLWTVAVAALLIGVPSAAWSWLDFRSRVEQSAVEKLARHWDDAEAREYRYQRPLSPRVVVPGDPQIVETASRALKDYGVIGADNCVQKSQDWRQRDDVRLLPPLIRADFELWLMEQTYRYCRGLEDRPDQPSDWRRALEIVDHIHETTPLATFAALGDRLRRKLGLSREPSYAKSAAGTALVAPGLDEYLLGIAAECAPPQADDGAPGRTAASRALEHYGKLLAIRPDSLWGHYRASAALFSLTRFEEALAHLRQCQAKRDNPFLDIYLASCLRMLNRFDEAIVECNRAIERAPDWAEVFRSRAFIRSAVPAGQRPSGQSEGLARDIDRFEVLSNLIPRPKLGRLPMPWDTAARDHAEGQPAPMPLGHLVYGNRIDDGDSRELDDDERHARIALADAIRKAGDFELASAELEKILYLDPDDFEAFMSHALLAIEFQRFEVAKRDLDAVLKKPGLIGFAKKTPDYFRRLRTAIRLLLDAGPDQELRSIIRSALDVAIKLGLPRGDLHYRLALCGAATSNREKVPIPEIAAQLWRAFAANRDWRKKYESERAFDSIRHELDRAIEVEARHRNLSASLAGFR